MSIEIDPDFQGTLLEALRGAIDAQIIPILKESTRVDTGALRDSTTTMIDGDRLLILQGGTPDSDHAIWVELKYGDFSRSVAAIDWQF